MIYGVRYSFRPQKETSTVSMFLCKHCTSLLKTSYCFYPWSLKDDGRAWLKNYGAGGALDKVKFRDAYILIGQRGLETGKGLEKVSRNGINNMKNWEKFIHIIAYNIVKPLDRDWISDQKHTYSVILLPRSNLVYLIADWWPGNVWYHARFVSFHNNKWGPPTMLTVFGGQLWNH